MYFLYIPLCMTENSIIYNLKQSQKHLFEYLCARCAKLEILSEDRKNMSLTRKKNSKESNNDKDIINVEMTNTITIETKRNKKDEKAIFFETIGTFSVNDTSEQPNTIAI